jgi:phosphopentomutase
MNNKTKRVFIIVLDSFGIGEMPDSADFGDAGSNTLGSISGSDFFSAPNLIKAGLSNIDGVECLENVSSPRGAYARLSESSKGKDTTTGHWEISGIVSKTPMPTYPNGFPEEVLEEFCRAIGKSGVLCNLPYSGTKVINDYGEEHLKTGLPIVYTSADSVFQIATHTDIVPLDTLYEYCSKARAILKGTHGVGRVIARPFTGKAPNFTRTSDRRDFSLEPPKPTMLNFLAEEGLDTIAVGKIRDIFAGSGISEAYPTHSNKEGMDEALRLADKDFNGLCFINLVDFDMLYGHRNDVDGYAKAISEFDTFLPSFINKMREDDILMITADHGCDPATESTDHSREYVPLIVLGEHVKSENLGTLDGFSGIAATVCDLLNAKYSGEGESFSSRIIK